MWQSGAEGAPAVLLVHGSAEDHRVFDPILTPLGARHRVFAIDRRGHGASGDEGAYALDREAEDIAAAIARIERPVTLVGCGYGALCALETARIGDGIDHLILFEPPIERRADAREADIAGEVARLAAIGQGEMAAELHLRLMAKADDETVDRLKADAAGWPAFVRAMPVLAREFVTVHGDYRFEAQRFAALDLWITLLIGRETDPLHLASGQVLAAAAPSAIVRWIPGADHAVVRDDPALFAQHLIRAIESYRDVARPTISGLP
ncbi:MAG: alpha/beta hydrolase [Azospirillaceae bacterium]